MALVGAILCAFEREGMVCTKLRFPSPYVAERAFATLFRLACLVSQVALLALPWALFLRYHIRAKLPYAADATHARRCGNHAIRSLRKGLSRRRCERPLFAACGDEGRALTEDWFVV